MKTFFTAMALFISAFALPAQNLVPNPSFESLGTAPCSWITSNAGFTSAVNNWTMPTGGSTDIFSNYVSTTCYAHNFSTHASRVGQQAPHSGNAMSALNQYGAGCGWQPNYREYLQVQLTSNMTIGQSYDIEFWVSLGDECRYATNNIGARFNTGATSSTTCFVLNQTPQFNYSNTLTNKTGWVRVSGSVTATAAWPYLIIGNFFSNAATNAINVGGTRDNTRYYIDDVVVNPAVILDADDLILDGERIDDGIIDLIWDGTDHPDAQEYMLQRSSDGNSWETVHFLEPEADQTSFAWQDHFPPAGELLYRVRYQDLDGQHIASNVLRFQGDPTLPYRFMIADHPVSSDQPIRFRIAQADDAPATLEIHDVQGRLMWSQSNLTVRDLDGFSIPAGTLSPNMYIVRLVTPTGQLVKKLSIQ